MAPPGANPKTQKKRTRKRKRRVASSSSESDSDSDSSSSSSGPSAPPARREATSKPPPAPAPASSSSSSSESDSDSSSDDSDSDAAAPAPAAAPAAARDQQRARSPSPAPAAQPIPPFDPAQDDAALRARFRKFWMSSVADAFQGDLEELRKVRSSALNECTGMLRKGVGAGDDQVAVGCAHRLTGIWCGCVCWRGRGCERDGGRARERVRKECVRVFLDEKYVMTQLLYPLDVHYIPCYYKRPFSAKLWHT